MLQNPGSGTGWWVYDTVGATRRCIAETGVEGWVYGDKASYIVLDYQIGRIWVSKRLGKCHEAMYPGEYCRVIPDWAASATMTTDWGEILLGDARSGISKYEHLPTKIVYFVLTQEFGYKFFIFVWAKRIMKVIPIMYYFFLAANRAYGVVNVNELLASKQFKALTQSPVWKIVLSFSIVLDRIKNCV